MVARGALSGGAVGALAGRGAGAARGAAIGGGIGLARALFTRGDEINLPAGTQVEMVLQRPLTFGPRQYVSGPSPSVTWRDSGPAPRQGFLAPGLERCQSERKKEFPQSAQPPSS